MCVFVGSSEASLLTDAISTKYSCVDQYQSSYALKKRLNPNEIALVFKPKFKTNGRSR